MGENDDNILVSVMFPFCFTLAVNGLNSVILGQIQENDLQHTWKKPCGSNDKSCWDNMSQQCGAHLLSPCQLVCTWSHTYTAYYFLILILILGVDQFFNLLVFSSSSGIKSLQFVFEMQFSGSKKQQKTEIFKV